MSFHWFDEKFAKHKRNYFLQPLVSAIFAFGVLIALGGYQHAEVLGVVGFTSLGSSAFIAFGTHNVITASTRNLLGGYLISVLVGVGCWEIVYVGIQADPHLAQYFLSEIFAAVAVAISMFFMVVFDVEHPPAAGFALGMVIEQWSWEALVTIIIAVTALALLRKILEPWLMSLL